LKTGHKRSFKVVFFLNKKFTFFCPDDQINKAWLVLSGHFHLAIFWEYGKCLDMHDTPCVIGHAGNVLGDGAEDKGAKNILKCYKGRRLVLFVE
jgi:hypothetical protein